MRPNYEKLTRQLHLENHVHFAGFCKQIEEWMHMSDVCVSTSLREGLGMNLLEAMSAEKPVIATENRGHCELVKHGVNGFLVKPQDVNSLADYLQQLYDKKISCPSWGKRDVLWLMHLHRSRRSVQWKKFIQSIWIKQRR